MVFQSGSSIYVSNLNSSGNVILMDNIFISNKIMQDTSNSSPGSVIYFDSSSNVSVERSTFNNNLGNIGACIYYLETQRNFFLVLKDNLFQNNKAQISGGAIYYSQIDESILEIPYYSNHFVNNTANIYGKDLASIPFKFKILEEKFNENNAKDLIPGITEFNVVVNITDFFNQTIFNLNSGFECSLMLKNLTYEENKYFEMNFQEIFIQGSTSTVAKNGK